MKETRKDGGAVSFIGIYGGIRLGRIRDETVKNVVDGGWNGHNPGMEFVERKKL